MYACEYRNTAWLSTDINVNSYKLRYLSSSASLSYTMHDWLSPCATYETCSCSLLSLISSSASICRSTVTEISMANACKDCLGADEGDFKRVEAIDCLYLGTLQHAKGECSDEPYKQTSGRSGPLTYLGAWMQVSGSPTVRHACVVDPSSRWQCETREHTSLALLA